MLSAIRSGEFAPDETRAGRFIKRNVPEEQLANASAESIAGNLLEGSSVLKESSNVSVPASARVLRDDENSNPSSDSESGSSSSDDESNASETQGFDLAKRRPTNFALPVDSKLYVCRTSRLLHIRTSGSGNIEEGVRLRCGKKLTLSYRAVAEKLSIELCRCITCFASLSSGSQAVQIVV